LLHGAIVATVATAALAWSTPFHAPPRFDGAGYAVLGQSLLTGHGFHEIDQPDQPPHAHYPPGYPAALAVLWCVTGRSTVAAHTFSLICTVAAVVVAWLWFGTLYRPRAALVLGLALALNWTWVRVGGEIQSEPLYLLLGQVAMLIAVWAGRRGGIGASLILGVVLAACILTRHVAIGLALAIGLDLLLRKRPAVGVAAAFITAVLVAPWVAWLVKVQHNTQVALLTRGSLAERVAGNALFYLRRLPDALTGPFIEVATVFRGSAWIKILATAFATLATGVLIYGWVRMLKTPRRRLGALVPFCTLALLLVWPFTEAGRFLIPLVPFLLVGAVEGLAGIGARAGLRRARGWALGAVLIGAVPYTAYSLLTDRAAAQQRSHAGFDIACAWIAREGALPGPILTRQPGEVFWLTGRQALLLPGDEPETIDQAIDRYGVAYILVDNERYAHAPANPLSRYVTSRPERVVKVWELPGDGSMSVYAVLPARPQRAAGPSKTSLP
jgi:hypothetical protein